MSVNALRAWSIALLRTSIQLPFLQDLTPRATRSRQIYKALPSQASTVSNQRKAYSSLYGDHSHAPTLPHNDSKVSVSSEVKSLAWRNVYDHSPTAYGITDKWGFFPIIPLGKCLPATKKVTMSNSVPYSNFEIITIQLRHSGRDVPVDLATTRMNGLLPAKEGKTKVTITMEMDKSLFGTLTAMDLNTKSRVQVEFDGSVACRDKSSTEILSNTIA